MWMKDATVVRTWRLRAVKRKNKMGLGGTFD